MKEIELEDKEIKLIISALDLKISHNLDRAYGNFPYHYSEKEKDKREVNDMELLVDKILNKLNLVEREEASLVIDWNMEEFKEKLKEAVKEVLV